MRQVHCGGHNIGYLFGYYKLFFPFVPIFGDKHVTLNMCDLRLTSDDCPLAPCLICRQDSRNEESMNTSSSFSSTPTMVDTPEVWVIMTMPKMPFPMEHFGDSEGGGKKAVRWSPYIEELDSSNYPILQLMPT